MHRHLKKIDSQHQRLEREVTASFETQHSRIASLERQLLAINSEKQARVLDENIHSSLSTLIIFDINKVPEFDVKTDFNHQEKLNFAIVAAMHARREALVKANPTKKYPEAVPPHHLVYLKKNPDKTTPPILLRFPDPRATSFARQLLSAKGDRNVVIGRIKDASYQEHLQFSLRLGYALKVGGLTPYYNIVPLVYNRASKPRILPQIQIMINGQRTIVKCAAPKSDNEIKQLVANAIRQQFQLEQPMIDSIVTHISQLTPRYPTGGAGAQAVPFAPPATQPRVAQPGGKKRDNAHLTPPFRSFGDSDDSDARTVSRNVQIPA